MHVIKYNILLKSQQVSLHQKNDVWTLVLILKPINVKYLHVSTLVFFNCLNNRPIFLIMEIRFSPCKFFKDVWWILIILTLSYHSTHFQWSGSKLPSLIRRCVCNLVFLRIVGSSSSITIIVIFPVSVDISKFTNPMINTNFIFTLYHTKINYNFYSDQHTYLKIKITLN